MTIGWLHRWGRRVLPATPNTASPEPFERDAALDSDGLHDNVGLRDMVGSGWFNNETGELFTGFQIRNDDVVLDVGCGDGGKTSFCARQGAHVIFVDVDPEQIELASQRMKFCGARKLTPIVSDTDPLPIAAGTASKVVASEVIEHVDDPVKFLNELVRVGRSGALYFLTVPDPSNENLHLQLAALPPENYFEKPNHIRVLTRDEFAKLIVDAGLIIENRGNHGFYSALWWLFLRAALADPTKKESRLLTHWGNTWNELLDTKEGFRVKAALDASIPQTQWIIARKP